MQNYGIFLKQPNFFHKKSFSADLNAIFPLLVHPFLPVVLPPHISTLEELHLFLFSPQPPALYAVDIMKLYEIVIGHMII